MSTQLKQLEAIFAAAKPDKPKEGYIELQRDIHCEIHGRRRSSCGSLHSYNSRKNWEANSQRGDSMERNKRESSHDSISNKPTMNSSRQQTPQSRSVLNLQNQYNRRAESPSVTPSVTASQTVVRRRPKPNGQTITSSSTSATNRR